MLANQLLANPAVYNANVLTLIEKSTIYARHSKLIGGTWAFAKLLSKPLRKSSVCPALT